MYDYTTLANNSTSSSTFLVYFKDCTWNTYVTNCEINKEAASIVHHSTLISNGEYLNTFVSFCL